MLEPEELKRRIDAARTLRGITQQKLSEIAVEDGLDKHELARAERGELAFTAKHRRALSLILRVPETWFTEPDVDRIVAYLAPDEVRKLETADRLLRQLAEVAEGLRQGREVRPAEPPGTGHRAAEGEGAPE